MLRSNRTTRPLDRGSKINVLGNFNFIQAIHPDWDLDMLVSFRPNPFTGREGGFFAGCSQARKKRRKEKRRKGLRPLSSPVRTGAGQDMALTEGSREKREEGTGRRWGKSCCISLSNYRRRRLCEERRKRIERLKKKKRTGGGRTLAAPTQLQSLHFVAISHSFSFVTCRITSYTSIQTFHFSCLSL